MNNKNEKFEYKELLFTTIKLYFDEQFFTLGFKKNEEIRNDSFIIEYKKKKRIIKFSVSLFPTDYPYYLSIEIIKQKILLTQAIPFWFILKNKSDKKIDFALTENSEYLSKIKIDELLTNIKNELFYLCEKFIIGKDNEFNFNYKKFNRYKIELQKNTI
ncbi:MAG: hypothetical protein IPH62_00810 [Ignavibacteriae bacterium]|nr:hypothetical protein [Ignavibacteriota bacterium]